MYGSFWIVNLIGRPTQRWENNPFLHSVACLKTEKSEEDENGLELALGSLGEHGDENVWLHNTNCG